MPRGVTRPPGQEWQRDIILHLVNHRNPLWRISSHSPHGTVKSERRLKGFHRRVSPTSQPDVVRIETQSRRPTSTLPLEWDKASYTPKGAPTFSTAPGVQTAVLFSRRLSLHSLRALVNIPVPRVPRLFCRRHRDRAHDLVIPLERARHGAGAIPLPARRWQRVYTRLR